MDSSRRGEPIAAGRRGVSDSHKQHTTIRTRFTYVLPFAFIRDLSGLGFVSALSTIAYVESFSVAFSPGTVTCRLCAAN